MKHRGLILLSAAVMAMVGLLVPSLGCAAGVQNHAAQGLMNLADRRDAVVIADPQGRILAEKNGNHPLVPASILKILTALVSLDALGAEYRFSTEFLIDADNNLIIKGRGDPLLVSEVIADMAQRVAALLDRRPGLNDLVLDETYFGRPLTIPGVSASAEPYDAPNGALCANFNTVNFRRTADGYASAEDQTPMLPFAVEKIKKSRTAAGRVVLSREAHENTIYAGKLFQYFFAEQGVRFNGSMRVAPAAPGSRLVMAAASPYNLRQVVARMLEFSNNFIANQMLIAAGAQIYGAPGSLTKGVRAARAYAADVLRMDPVAIVEGSGISRENRVSARQMLRVLQAFEPYHELMRRNRDEYYKTGTLKGVSTRAGYLLDARDRRYPFVVMVNSPGKSADMLMQYLRKIVQHP